MRMAAFLIVLLAFTSGLAADDPARLAESTVAATAVDLYQDMESGTSGDPLTPALMNASSHGKATWSVGRGEMWVSTDKARALPGPVTVGGTSYAGKAATRRWMFHDSDALNYVVCSLPDSCPKITVACYYTPGVTIRFANQFDTICMTGNQGYSVLQTRNDDGQGPYFRAHSCTVGWKTTFSPKQIKIVPGKTYWVNLHFDANQGKTSVAAFDPDRAFAQVGDVVVADAWLHSTGIRQIRFGRADNHGPNPTAKTQSYLDQILIDYSHGAFPLVPANAAAGAQSEFRPRASLHAGVPIGGADSVVRPRPPYVAWFQPKFYAADPGLYRHLTLDAGGTVPPEQLQQHGAQGLAWAYGINNPDAHDPNYWRDICSPEYRRWAGLGKKPSQVTSRIIRPGVALDEWCNPAYPKSEQWAVEGLRQGRKQWSDCFVAVWITDLTEPLAALVRDGTVDLLILECYTHAPASLGPGPFAQSLPGVYHRVGLVKKAGLLDKAIICLGHITDEPDLKGRRLTPEGLRSLAADLRQRFPESPGIAFYQAHDRKTARELIRVCDEIGAGFLTGVKP